MSIKKRVKPMVRSSYELSDWQGYLTHGEIDALKWCANDVLERFADDPLWCVGVGAGAGTSTIAMLEESKRIRVISIDIETDKQEWGTNEHLRLDEMGMKDRVLRIWGDSKQVGKIWPVAWKVPMVFVDGDHSEAGLRGDIDGWLQHIMKGGIISFHDYGGKFWGDVQKVIDEVMKDYEMLVYADTTIAFRV